MNTHPIQPERKPDRRIARTRAQLSEALMDLILERGYDAITIEDITNRANLGRTTFYLHFRDKEDLLIGSVQSTALDLYQQIVRERNTFSPQEGLRAIERVFQHAAANSTLYRIIMKGGAAARVRLYILEIVRDASLPFFQRELVNPVPAPFSHDVIANYFASTLLGFLTWWLEAEMPYAPDEASYLFTSLFLSGINPYTAAGQKPLAPSAE